MPTVIDEMELDQHDRREQATNELASILARYDEPEEGDAIVLRSLMKVLDLTNGDVKRLAAVVKRVAEEERQLLSQDARREIRETGDADLAAAHDVQRAVLHAQVDALPTGYLHFGHHALARLGGNARLVNQHQADFDAAATAAHRAELHATNRLREDDERRALVTRLRNENPLIGRMIATPPAPAPVMQQPPDEVTPDMIGEDDGPRASEMNLNG